MSDRIEHGLEGTWTAALYQQARRKLLIVEDNALNREILSSMLEDEYVLLEAENGREGLEMLAQHSSELSLVLLDVHMPVCDGFEFLEIAGKDPFMSRIPIIVTTGSSSREDEVRCLELGASDFVTKPYNPEVVRARVHSMIKLKESVAALSAVEYDDLTGLYTMSAFYHHAALVMHGAPGKEFDLIVADLKDFKLVNSVYGSARGDELLIHVGEVMRSNFKGALISRQGDMFFALMEAVENHEKQYRQLEKTAEQAAHNLTIKFGVYRTVDKNTPVSILCDRAVMAVATIKDDAIRAIAEYDEEIHRKLLANQRMEMDFEEAMQNKEFVVWYQPKVNAVTGKIIGAEALVRWKTEDGQMIPPGVFVPLLERNGRIRELDRYVFREVCLFQKRRIDQGKRVVPISVNMSRNSIYREDTLEIYRGITSEIRVPKHLVPIELTESAAMEGPRIIELTESFSRNGFYLHLDDFGNGYSSLSSLASMPFDVLKIDKSLNEHIGKKKGNSLLRYMVGLAKEVGMEVVAEGVEKQEQVEFLNSIGCDQIQGYYFYQPTDAEKFEALLDG
ncbi:MAG: EAL domain-containing protein [Lachnospiraceae bacterium]|nr:EAL domain-containing protein [Lachnospiraceae bacterium]